MYNPFLYLFQKSVVDGVDNCGDDCPIWPGMYEFCAISAGYLSPPLLLRIN